MYRRIVLAYDGSREGRRALREGALLAKGCGAEVFLLSVVAETAGIKIGESAVAGAVAQEHAAYQAILEEGVQRLREHGCEAHARLVQGEPAREIAAFAREACADLVVVAHRKMSTVARWWSGSTGAYLLDHIGCSLLVARNDISDEQFEHAFSKDVSLRNDGSRA
jgi:nucleotide-binding universal stress UspA family protein